MRSEWWREVGSLGDGEGAGADGESRHSLIAFRLPRAKNDMALNTIKLILFSLALTPSFTSAKAEWARLSVTAERIIYFDPINVEAKGNIRRVWQLIDYVAEKQKGNKSVKALTEIDCIEKRVRVIDVIGYSEKMGGGQAITSKDPASGWSYIPPKSAGDLLLIATCAPRPNWNNNLKIFENDDTIYSIDSTSITNHDTKVRFWQLQDLRNTDNLGARSRQGYFEFDCQKLILKAFILISTTGNTGSGKVLLQGYSQTRWATDVDTKAQKSIIFASICDQWILIDKSVITENFVSSKILGKQDGVVKVWELLNLAHGHKQPESSYRMLREYDCTKNLTRTLTATAYSDHMAKGLIIDRTNSPGPWANLLPMERNIFNRVCLDR
ncbi:MAG: hypothetical protein KIT13_04250 [Burkholderiales bacterium]|nr:hypothetical protein [Burkholderiales bacterium]